MKLIERDEYMEKLRRVMGTPDIKVLTGVRRCGKSKLMEMFMEYVKRTVPDANVIHANLSLAENEWLLEYHRLNSFIENSCIPGRKNFVFIDEVQMCSGFERTINGLHASEKYDIYITGSNAFLLGSDLATLFTGRTFDIEVFPFSFKEYVKYFGCEIPYKSLDDYLKNGGMAGAYEYAETEEKYEYAAGVYDTLIVRDVKQKYRIRNTEALEKISSFLMDNVSNQTSPNNIAECLLRDGCKIDRKTVSQYMDYLCRAFAFYKVKRWDVRGKKYFATNDKYYLSDHVFRYAKLGSRSTDRGRMLENVVAVELMRRGYKVYTGVLYKKEIDFVAVKREKILYVQVADNISAENTFEREVSPLLQIRDAYPKLLIARTWQPEYLHEGIRVIDAADWLLNG